MSSDEYGVIGHPIAHSLSPVIHGLFAEQTDQTLRYRAIDIAPAALKGELKRLFRRGVRGLNVTMPHKTSVIKLCHSVTERAQLAGACNTLIRDAKGRILGDTTDGAGLAHDLTETLGLDLASKKILLLGAGGSVWSVAGDLLALSPGQLVIANRTLSKAQRVAAAFDDLGPVSAMGMDSVAGSFDLVLNATSSTVHGALPQINPECVSDAVCYDLMYGADGTPFTQWCDEQGASAVHTGIGMLVEQAALSFEIWRGVRPQTEPVREALLERYGFQF
ncbi:MAG: shikimate dehydrogenase [Gammaproteobacteria bacterium]